MEAILTSVAHWDERKKCGLKLLPLPLTFDKMNAYEYIIGKQVAWARKNQIDLRSSVLHSGRKAYTTTLSDNLFQDLHPGTRAEIEQGNGGELTGTATKAAKMSALHSSSVLGVNVFDYWKTRDIARLAALLGLSKKETHSAKEIQFEQKFRISPHFRIAPNLDVVIRNGLQSKIKTVGIECKFSEAYGSRAHPGLKQAYLTAIPDLWTDLPHLFEFAKTISPDDNTFAHLHPAQLVKHILGLKNESGKEGFGLLYLWYDVLGTEGAAHRQEIQTFAGITKADGILFHALTYQELILQMNAECYAGNEAYVDYLSARYL